MMIGIIILITLHGELAVRVIGMVHLHCHSVYSLKNAEQMHQLGDNLCMEFSPAH